MKELMRPVLLAVLMLILFFDNLTLAWGHHVLGRPAYRFSEDSSTPPALFVETQIGHYMVNVMVYPAFPKAGQESRIKLYATHLDTHNNFTGPVHFAIRDDVMFGNNRAETLGTQTPVDGIYRQIVLFSDEGDYIVTASFEAEGEPYIVDLPITIGQPRHYGTLAAAVGVILGVLVLVRISRRKRRRTPLESPPPTADP